MLTENREFNEIYEKYKNLILKAAYTYSGSYSAAEDITQYYSRHFSETVYGI